MPKFVWNGGFQLDYKTVTFILWGVFVTGGGWWKLQAMEKTFEQQLMDFRLHQQTLLLIGYRTNSIEERVDKCCPLYEGPISPQDIEPPSIRRNMR